MKRAFWLAVYALLCAVGFLVEEAKKHVALRIFPPGPTANEDHR